MAKFKGLTIAGVTLLGAAIGSAFGSVTLQGAIGFWTG